MMNNGSTILDISNEPAQIHLNGTSYKLRVLGPGDFAKAAAHLRNRRINEFLSSTRLIPLTDQTRASALADITCKPIPLSDLLGDYESEIYLLALSLDDNPGVTYETLCKMPAIDREVLTDIMFHICKLSPATGDEEANPTTPTIPCSEEKSNGET